MKSLRVLSIASLAVILASCCPCRKPSSFYDQFDKLLGTEWRLLQKDDKVLPDRGQNNYTITFGQDKRVSGIGDCNRYSGIMAYSVTQEVQKFSISQIASTRMACLNMAAENEFFDFLRNANRVNMDGDLLIMLSTDSSKNTKRWVFEKVK